MQLNPSDNSNGRLVEATKVIIEFTKPVVSVLGCVLVGSIITYGLFLFGKIVWAFLAMFIQALGQL